MRATPEEFAQILIVLAEGYNAELSATKMALYEDALSDIDVDALRRSCREAVRRCRFFPTVAELRECALGNDGDRALVAWSGLEQAAAKVGAWGALIIDDPAAAEAFSVTFGSWPAYCALEGNQAAGKRSEFLAAYRIALTQARVRPLHARIRPVEGRLFKGLTDGTTGWGGRITAVGSVAEEPMARLLEAHGAVRRPALGQGSDAEAGEGSEETPGSGSDRGGPAEG